MKKINFDNIDNMNLKYFKNSNKKIINKDISNELYEDAKRIYYEFRNKLISK